MLLQDKLCAALEEATYPALMPLRAVIWEGISVAHILRAIVGVDRKLVLCTLLPQMHHLAQVALQLLSSAKHSNPLNKSQGVTVSAASNTCNHTHMPGCRKL